jgi:hypothetical protein
MSFYEKNEKVKKMKKVKVTVLPALSNPNIRIEYSGFSKCIFHNPAINPN